MEDGHWEIDEQVAEQLEEVLILVFVEDGHWENPMMSYVTGDES